MARADQSIAKAADRHADDLAALLRAVVESPAVTDTATRDTACHGGELLPPLRQYVDKVYGASYRITDDDVQALLAAGYPPDAVFEMTVAAALGAALQRLEAGLGVLR